MEDNAHSLKKIARRAGLLYFALALMGPISLIYVPDKIFVPGDATATANNILASESLFRLGIVTGIIGDILFIFVALALYRLFEGVSRILSRQLLALVLVSAGIALINEVNQLGALIVLHGDDFLKVFSQDQLNTMAMIFEKLHGRGIVIDQIFWGLWLVPFGILVIKSGFIPKIIGILMMFPAFGYVFQSFTLLFVPQFYPDLISTLVMIFGFGELPVIFWLLIKGVKTQKETKESTHQIIPT